jgi:hypothetical protein
MISNFDNLFDDAATIGDEPVIEPTDGQRIDNPLRFILAGNATFTLRSRRTGARFTYKVEKADDKDGFWFVKVLTGPENTRDYTYLGNISPNKLGYVARYGSHAFWHDKKQRVSPDAPSAKAFAWAFKQFVADAATPELDVFFAGSCGRCGRQLTVPESVTAGFGPECIGKV